MVSDSIATFEDMLFSRLSWPSPMVRERACCAIAIRLLSDGGELWKLRLLDWIADQHLETRAIIGLLVGVKARQLNAIFAPSLAELENALVVPSVSSSIILWSGLREEPTKWRFDKHFEVTPPKVVVPIVFEKSLSVYLPPAYDELRRKFDQLLGSRQFTMCWAHHWIQIREAANFQVEAHSPHFLGRRDTLRLPIAEFPASELYKSSFIRATSELVSCGRLGSHDGLEVTRTICPIDLDLWNVSIKHAPPVWWPKFTRTDSVVDTIVADGIAAARELASMLSKGSDSQRVVYAAGPLSGTKGLLRVEVVSFLQRANASGMPDADNVYDALNSERSNILHSCFPLGSSGRLTRQCDDLLPIGTGGWEILPIVHKTIPAVIPQWQTWRGFTPMWLPNPGLFDGDVGIQVNQDKLTCACDGELIGEWGDWVDLLEERLAANLPPRVGQYLTVSSEYLERFCSEFKAEIGYVWRVLNYHRPKGYGEYEEYCEHGIVGGNSIIRL